MSISRVEFSIVTPGTDTSIAEHIAASCATGLPEADDAPLRKLTIIANGPSARHIDLTKLDGDTLAVNGAIRLFMAAGLAPTYWAACDPQELVAEFIPDDPPASTIYLVAGKCHPRVRERLRGRDVRLWHINDHPAPYPRRTVACASSVTLVVMTLMRKLGYRAFETYGWDGCYDGDLHHASEQPVDVWPENTIDVAVGASQVVRQPRAATRLERWLFAVAAWLNRASIKLASLRPIPQPVLDYEGGRMFKTSTTWAAESQDAVVQLHHADYEVVVHGEGMVRAVLEQYRGSSAARPVVSEAA